MLFISHTYAFSCVCCISLYLFLSLMHGIFYRIDAETEVACELVAKPIQELQTGEQQENAVEHAPEEIANPTDLQGKPRSISLILITPCYI